MEVISSTKAGSSPGFSLTTTTQCLRREQLSSKQTSTLPAEESQPYMELPSISTHCSPAAPGMGPWLHNTQLLLCTPRELLKCSKPQPGPERRTATFLRRCAHNPAQWPAPGRLQRLSAAGSCARN